LAAGIAFELAYPIIAWLCWVPNLLLAEMLFNRAHNPSIERTSSGKLRLPPAAAHVER
jgi:hypothetical protein